MSGTDDRANKAGPEAEPPAGDDAHTARGAPTDRAHQGADDGTLTGSVPAGLGLEQLREAANNDKTDDSGTS
jgi:hypothetical protein